MYRAQERAYGPFPNVQAMETAGDLVATLEPVRYIDSWYGIGSGYMLFTTPGKWKVSVFQGDEVVASVVLLVSGTYQPPNPYG